jgi:polysaccharide chain length determinant protein (PEP-CTERM system associated)
VDELDREQPGASFNLGDLVGIIKRRKWWIALPTVLLSAAAITVALMLPPVFRAEGTILIERPNVPPDLIDSTVTSYADERIEKIRREFIASDNLARIVEKYDLYPEMRREAPMADVIHRFRQGIQVELIQSSRREPAVAFQVGFEYSEPGKAQQVASEIATWYLRENLRTRQEKSRETAEFLNQQTSALASEVGRLEEELAEFKKENAGQLPNQQDLIRGEVIELQRSLRDLNFERQSLGERRADLAQTLAGIQSGSEPAALAPDSRLEDLRDERATLAAQYTEKHPDIVSLDRRIAALEARQSGQDQGTETSGSTTAGSGNPQVFQIREELAAIDRNLNALARRRDVLRSDIEEKREALRQAAAIEDEYRALQREYDNTVTDYRTLRRKKLTADMGASLELNQKGERFTLIEPPQEPFSPIEPDRQMIVLAGAFMSLAFGCGLAFLREMADGSLRGVRKLEALTGAQPLAVVPYIRTRREFVRAWAWRGASAAGVLAAAAGGLFYVHTHVVPLDIVASQAEQQVDDKLDRFLK